LGMSAVVVSATLVSAWMSLMISYPKFYREYSFMDQFMDRSFLSQFPERRPSMTLCLDRRSE
jgi:hypothetical protein